MPTPALAQNESWFRFDGAEEIPTPALLVYPARVRENIAKMAATVDSVERLRPHIKTHKSPDALRLHLAAGIKKFKAATIAELEMAAAAGAPDLLLAYPAVGPAMRRLLDLVQNFRATRFSALVDDAQNAQAIGEVFRNAGEHLTALMDLDVGMGRTGVAPDEKARQLYHTIAGAPGLVPGGFHLYDGHIHDADIGARAERCDAAFAPVLELKARLERDGLPAPRIVAGGTPTFPIHARRPGLECSPGTYVFWDFGYQQMLPEMPYRFAALLLARVISKPGARRLCVDLGHKAVAAENPPPRARFLNLPEAQAVGHSEEHLVLETPDADHWNVGDLLWAVPRHICPTVALHSHAWAIEDGKICGQWRISARERKLRF